MIRKLSALFLGLVIASIAIWPLPASTASISEIVPDKGLVVFYRLRKMGGAAITYSVDHADGSLGILNNGAVLYKYFEPGQHTFYSQVLSGDSIMINVEAGKAYFVQGMVKMGVVAGRPSFTQVDEATGRAAVAGI
jgi:hypothetical protein